MTLRYCANLNAIRYKSTSLNRIIADKLQRVIAALDAEMQLLRQLISGKDNKVKVDNSLGTNHLVVWCYVWQLTFKDSF